MKAFKIILVCVCFFVTILLKESICISIKKEQNGKSNLLTEAESEKTIKAEINLKNNFQIQLKTDNTLSSKALMEKIEAEVNKTKYNII